MKKRINVMLDDDVIEKADQMAKSLGLSRSSYISFLISAVNEVTAASSVTPEHLAEEIAEESSFAK